MAQKLNLDFGFSGGNTDRGTKFQQRFLVPGKCSSSGNGAIVAVVLRLVCKQINQL